jgi:NitT/TauT family transport system substrate-binding protein
MPKTSFPDHQAPLSRKEFLRLSALLALPAMLPMLASCGRGAKKADGPLRIGYLPITDAAPLLVAHGKGLFEAEGLDVEKPTLFRGWSQIVEAFLAGQVDVAHLLSPVVLWMRYASHTQAKVVAWNHLDGSGLVVANGIHSVGALGGKTVAIPHWYSIHNIVLQQLLRANQLQPISRAAGKVAGNQVSLVVMAPSDMVPALAAGQIAGFIVAEPFCALAEATGTGRMLRFTGDVWQEHACCQVVMHEEDLTGRPEWSQKVVNAVVKAELWLRDNRAEAAELLSAADPHKYTPHSAAVLKRVLDPDQAAEAGYIADGAIQHPEWKAKRIDFEPYPYPSYTEKLIGLLKETVVEGDNSFLAKLDPAAVARDLVDDSFARKAIASVGGLAAFGLPDAFSRNEVVRP